MGEYSIQRLMEKISQNTFDIGSSLWVDVTFITHPHNFSVRPTIYRPYLNQLHIRKSKIDVSKIILPKAVIYKSKISGEYIRGLVLKVDDDDLNIYAPDVGCFEEDVHFENVYLPANGESIPPLATRCQLAHCTPLQETWSKKSIDAMRTYIGTERALITVIGKSADGIIVELKNSCPDDVATLMALTGYSTLGYVGNTVNRFMSPAPAVSYFRYKTLNVGDILYAMVLIGRHDYHSFYVADVNKYKHYLSMRSDYTLYCRQQLPIPEERIRVGDCVGALNDLNSKYERGLVKEIDKDMAKIKLVDLGIVIVRPRDRLMPLPEAYLRMPRLAIHCAVNERQAMADGLQNINLLKPGIKILITIKEVGKGSSKPHTVYLSRVCT